MPPFSTYEAQDRIKLLLLGNPKVGKTGLLATLANAGFKVRIIDFDNNLAIMNSYLQEGAEKLVDFVSLNAKDVNSWKKSIALTKKWDDGSNPREWGTDTVLVIDSASFWTDNALEAARAKQSKDPRIDYYAAQNDIINEVASLTSKDYKCHLILITHWRDQLQKADEVYKSVPAFFGNNLPMEIPKYCNNVWGCSMKMGDKRIIKTQSTLSSEFLGCSHPKILKVEEEFDLGVIFRKLYPN